MSRPPNAQVNTLYVPVAAWSSGWLAALGAILLAGTAAAATPPKLLVFLHVAVKQRAFQGELQAALTGVDVTAVGRIGDFDRALSDGPDAVLTLPLILAARGLGAALRGRHAGIVEEKYILTGADSVPDPSRVRTVGAIDLLGREGTDAFVQRMVSSKPKVERVTKVEDLLPLLQMQRVDAILLPARLFTSLQAASRLALTRTDLPTKVELPAVASVGGRGSQIMSAVSKLPSSLSGAVGVDEWG